jgi:AcrR family transcriptional regulator
VDEVPGLRERKKAATRQALHEAALRLAARDGPDHVTVEAIADAANVSRRTFSNYFSSKEEALFHGDAVRVRRMLQLVGEQPSDVPPWEALTRAAEQLVAEMDHQPDRAWLRQRQQLRGHPNLVMHLVAVYSAAEAELAAELARRLSGTDVTLRSRVLAAAFLSSLRVATQEWIEDPDRPLPDTMRTVLRDAAPALLFHRSAAR